MDKQLIPNSVGFTIDRKGNVFDQDGNKRTTYKNGDGYITVSIKLLNGSWVTFGVHRLVALTYLANERKPEHTEVNHKDFIIENNDVDNLEWVTCTENNIHSEIMRKDNHHSSILVYKNNLAFNRFSNIYTASKETNISVLDIWRSIKDHISINGYIFKYRKYNEKIDIDLHKEKVFLRNTDGTRLTRAVKALNIKTKEILHFPSLHAAATYFETSPHHIFYSITTNNKFKLFRKSYQIDYEENAFVIATKEDIIKALQHGPKPVIAYDLNSKKYFLFESAKEFINLAKISRKAVTTSLAKNIIRVIDSWIMLYSSAENINRLDAYLFLSREIDNVL